MKPHIAVVYPCGRKIVSKVVNTLVRQLKNKNHFERYEISLIIAFDETYGNLKASDFRQPKSTCDSFRNVLYLNVGDFSSFKWIRDKYGISESGFEILFKHRGYSTQKNLALFHAMLIQSDYVVFLDDDEYYTAPTINPDNSLIWHEQDVIGNHIGYLEEADITNGMTTGFFSPIPSDLNSYLNDELSRTLGCVLSYGSEFISEETFSSEINNIRYIDSTIVNSLPNLVPIQNGTRFVTGSNLGFNMKAVANGLIPPLFNPVNARGEDAILGTQIYSTKLLRIPVHTFHDPFLQYVDILEGSYPDKLVPIRLSTSSMQRFLTAFLGWISYAPLFIRLTSMDEHEESERIGSMNSSLPGVCKSVSQRLGCVGFLKGVDVFSRFYFQMDNDYSDYMHSKDTWKQLINLHNS